MTNSESILKGKNILALDAETVRKRLKKINIRVNDDDKIKDLADKHNTTPIKMLTLILVEDS